MLGETTGLEVQGAQDGELALPWRSKWDGQILTRPTRLEAVPAANRWNQGKKAE